MSSLPPGPSPFEGAVDAVRSLVPAELGPFGAGGHRWGLKLWFGDTAKAPKFHYEAQLMGGKHIGAGVTVAIEVGFHAEHGDDRENERVVAGLVTSERKWRKALGADATPGPFLGNAHWRRLSETWIDPDLGEPGLDFEIASRLVDYAAALEPLLRKLPSAP